MTDALPQPLPLLPPRVAVPLPWRTRLGLAPRRLAAPIGRGLRHGPLLSLLSLGAALLVGAAVLAHADRGGARVPLTAPVVTGTAWSSGDSDAPRRAAGASGTLRNGVAP